MYMIFFSIDFFFLIKSYLWIFWKRCIRKLLVFSNQIHEVTAQLLHDLTNPTGSVYFLWTKSLDGTSLHVKWRLQENPPTWYPPFLEYSRVCASMASTIGQTTLLGNSLIRDKIGSSLKSSTKGNNSSRAKGVAYSLLPWLNGWHGLWPQWCLESLEFICLHPSKSIASNFKDQDKPKRDMFKKSGFYVHSLPLG